MAEISTCFANDAHSHEKKLLLRNRARRGQERSVIRNSKRVSVREHTFLLYRKVLLWRTLDIKVARTEAGIANKR